MYLYYNIKIVNLVIDEMSENENLKTGKRITDGRDVLTTMLNVIGEEESDSKTKLGILKNILNNLLE